jgi:hypothetical protein
MAKPAISLAALLEAPGPRQAMDYGALSCRRFILDFNFIFHFDVLYHQTAA